MVASRVRLLPQKRFRALKRKIYKHKALSAENSSRQWLWFTIFSNFVIRVFYYNHTQGNRWRFLQVVIKLVVRTEHNTFDYFVKYIRNDFFDAELVFLKNSILLWSKWVKSHRLSKSQWFNFLDQFLKSMHLYQFKYVTDTVREIDDHPHKKPFTRNLSVIFVNPLRRVFRLIRLIACKCQPFNRCLKCCLKCG